MTITGKLYGVGLGPGDPELMTLKAARLIRSADVIAYHCGVNKESNARRIAANLIPVNAIEEKLRYPVTTGSTNHPGGYAGALADFYEESAQRLAAHLSQGRSVVVLAEGDPLFYGSFMYMHDRLATDFETEIVPGVPAFAAATAILGTPLVRHTDVLTVLPGTMPTAELARRLADTDAAIIMKLGRTFPSVVTALKQSGKFDRAMYVERAAMPSQRWMPVAAVDPAEVPYFSLIVVPAIAEAAEFHRDSPHGVSTSASGGVHVIGLGPGPDKWLTPEASDALNHATHVIGYAPYVARVAQREGLIRLPSGNTVEIDRAKHALELAQAGHNVAVVSGGDAGIFGMASAIFEAAEDDCFAGIPIKVLPGVSAVQAVAARAGAPIGADFAVISLSDRLKPWATIESRLAAIFSADLVLAVYNPASSERTEQIHHLKTIALTHQPAETVVIIGRNVGRDDESLTVTTLQEWDTSAVDMKCLIIIGSTGTRVLRGQVYSARSSN